MTDEILQTDIDLAKRLIDDGYQDAEIIHLLAQRRIAPNRAARLVSELREGLSVEPDRVWRAVALQSQQSRSTRRQTASGQTLEQKRTAAPAPLRVPWFRIMVASAVLCCIAAAVWIGRQRNARVTEQELGSKAANGKIPTAPRIEAAALQIEIREGILKLGGRPVGPDDALGVFTSAVGAPTRTNRLEGIDKIVYVYDDYGLLVYRGRENNPNAVVIDFEASGGDSSAGKPFRGIVKIEGESVDGSTDPRNLSIVEENAVSNSGDHSGIYNLHLNGLRLVLACLTRPDRLSQITIDFEESWVKPLH